MGVLIIDITRVTAGNEANFVTGLWERYVSLEPDVIVVGLEAQRPIAEGLGLQVTFRATPTGYEPQVRADIAAVLREILNQDLAAHPLVCSYHLSIQRKEDDLAALAHAFEAVSPKGVLKRQPATSAEAWPTELIPLGQALDVLRTALRDVAGHTVWKTDVRHHLARVDKRFLKNHDPAARSSHLITRLLDAAVSEGIVRITGNEPRVRVHLVEEGPGGERAGHLARTSALVQRTAAAGRPEFQPETRSQELQHALRRHQFGPHVEVREILYGAIEKTVADSAGEEVLVGDLVHAAVKLTRDEAPSSFPRRRGDDLLKEQYPWRDVEGFAVRLLGRGGMITDGDGRQLREGPVWTLRKGRLAALAAQWQLRLDAELVLEIVRHRTDVSWQDGVDLAGALYLKRTDEYVDRIDRIVEMLLEERLVDVMADTECLRAVGRQDGQAVREAP